MSARLLVVSLSEPPLQFGTSSFCWNTWCWVKSPSTLGRCPRCWNHGTKRSFTTVPSLSELCAAFFLLTWTQGVLTRAETGRFWWTDPWQFEWPSPIRPACSYPFSRTLEGGPSEIKITTSKTSVSRLNDPQSKTTLQVHSLSTETQGLGVENIEILIILEYVTQTLQMAHFSWKYNT